MGQRWQSTPRQWARLRDLARAHRTGQTPAEALLWDRLRGSRLCGIKFRRQHAIDRFLVDFYAAVPRLVIEVDGPIHDDSAERDRERQRILESRGLLILRFTNETIIADIETVLRHISNTAVKRLPP